MGLEMFRKQLPEKKGVRQNFIVSLNTRKKGVSRKKVGSISKAAKRMGLEFSERLSLST